MPTQNQIRKIELLVEDIKDTCSEADISSINKWIKNEWQKKIRIRYRWCFSNTKSNWCEMSVSKKDNIKDCMNYVETFEGLDRYGSKLWKNFEYEII